MTNVIKYLQRNSYLFVLGISIIYLLTILAILTYPTAFPSGEYTVKFGAAEINMAAKSYEIINPSFEEGEEQPIGWVPIAWSGSPSFEWSFNMSKSAYRSVKISSSSFTSSAWITHQDYSYKVTPGKVYIGSVYAKTENVANGEGALVSIAWFDANNKYISTTAGSGFIGSFTWKKIRVEGLAPENAAKAELELHLHGTGTVWYDDVEFAEKVDQYQISQLEKTSRKGLDSASIRIDQSELVLIGTFAYPYDEKLIYNKTIKLDTNEFTLMSITYKTSAPNNAGLLIVINYSDGTKVTTYGTSFSLDWTTVYIDLRKTPAYLYYLGDLRQIVPGKELSSIEILLDDRPDTVSEGTYQLLIKNITFYRYASHHLLFSAQSGILLILAAFWGIHSLRSENRRRPIFLLALLGAAISLTATATQLLLPLPAYLNGIDLTLIMQLIGVLLVLAVLITYRYGKFSTGDNYETGNSIPNKVIIGYVLGLILIPSISFLIRFNNAITIPLFDDELSLGLTSWGLLHGSFVGLNLAAFDPVAASLLETGIFNVRAWPNGLSMPFTSTALYPNFSIVEPYLAQPYFVPLVIASSIVILGFNAIAIRLPLIFLNIGTIMLIYLIAARKENVLAGLIASSFFGLTPYSSHYGSEAYLDNSLAFFFLVTIYFLLMYLDNQENGKTHATKYAYLSAVFAALGALSKIQG
ncbi:MAG: glycosyltransferase family 39 protein, partial [Nitrososphaerota archaeon]